MSESSVPKAQDLVLGGEMPPPVSGAVLGGLVGLQQRFQQSELAQKLAALEAAATYGAEAIPLLRQGLESADLTVRSAAYSQLRKLGVSSPDLERGIPLRVGDRIYGVYESAVSYGDDWYYIYARIDEDDYDNFLEESGFYQPSQDSNGYKLEYVADAPEDNQRAPYEDYNPSLVAYCLNPATAEAKAQIVYEEKFGKLGCEIYELDMCIESDEDGLEEDDQDVDAEDIPQSNISKGFNLKAWVEANQVIVDAKLPYNWKDDDWSYRIQVLMSLQNRKQFSLLRELWQQEGYRPLAFVHEYEIDRPCYLRLHTLET
ncbi:hypothetical protein [Pantanalinema sp. GBBB05]|uniref:hypothetical protein n=1 Tax=Pantanalinema sp. GBBB05 TaxID=2604139 RepID=UPI001DC65EEE|nr:hypothetical protein [Pantanalinema sp. GBBB05]